MVDVAGSIGGVVSPLLQVGEWLAAPIWRQFKYVFNYRSNFNSLQEQVDKLKNTRDEVQHKVTAAERNVEEIKQNVKNWQAVVEKTITKAEQLIQQNENNPRCFKGLCPNFIIYHKQSKKAFKLKRDDIDPLLQQERELGPVSNPSIPPEIWLRTSEDYLTFESRNSTMKNVWDALNDENVFMIGVYGMGGLGKTTLVQEIGRKAEKEKLFDDIVFAEVSESPDIKKIQTTIADKLKLKFENESEMSNKLYSRMENKNILLILDNIWKPIELDKMIGIPCGADRGRNKLLFTTRNVDVLERMGSTSNFGMGFLNDDEAWTLFTKMAGNVIQVRKLYSLPNEVCKECGGLPIVICTIAKALKNKSDPSDWRVALQELRAPTPTKFTGFLEEEYTKIALSYKYLRDELKKTFLISSLLENNTSISDLFRHVVCLDILEGANLTMEEARDRLDKLVRDLKDACLILGELRSEKFAMHDVVRAVAITIAYVDHHVFTTRNDIEREWKDRDKLKKCTKISLSGNSPIISQLWPNYFSCPNLEYFYMTNMWESSFKFPEDIFMVMPKLRVMNLVGLQQSSLSSSIDLLANLQSLCLDNSNVKDFSIIGKLKTLKVLSLQKSTIEQFLIEFGQLIHLRVLDLSKCWKLKVVAPNVISQLSQLEEFYIKKCPIKWKHEVLEEVKLLSKLTILELDIKDNNVLPKDFFSKELKRYKISIGPLWFDFGDSQKILQFKFNSIIYLEKLHGIKNVEVLQLFESSIEKNDTDASKVILRSNDTRPLFNKKVIFTDLMSLELVNISFGMIWESQLSTSSYENLTKLILDQCNKIKYVFPFFVAKSLQQLQYFKIKNCEVLEKIVEKEEEEEGIEVVNSIFPHITTLMFEDLPELTVFYPGAHVLELPKLKDLYIYNCLNFTSRYQDFQDNNEEGEVQVSESKSTCLEHKVILTNLMTLEFVNISFETIWESQFSISYENLTKLILDRCNRIKYVFPFLVAKSLQQLQYIQIRACKVLEKIVEKEEEEIEVVNSIFPHITKLVLQDLPKLIVFYQGAHALELPLLKELKIKECPNFTSRYEGFQDNNEKGEVQVSKSKSNCLKHKINSDLKVIRLGDDWKGETRKIDWWSEYKTLDISHANISVGLLQRFYNLKVLCVTNSPFEPKLMSKVVLTNLMTLELVKISFEIIWESQLSTSSFENLTKLILDRCNKIKYAFPFFVAKSLQQLQYLRIRDCKVLEKIVEKEEEEGIEVVNSIFPHISKLVLQDLPKLTVFNQGAQALNLSLLKELKIEHCPNFYECFQDNNEKGEVQVSKSKSICLEHKINSDLEGIHLEDDWNSIEINWWGKSKTLEISYANISVGLLQRFYNVEVLCVASNDRLMSLLSFSVYFQNLKVLKLINCLGLTKKLITPSMAKSLVQLRKMKIENCTMLTEIVENEEDEMRTEIVFNNLNKLSLLQLDYLTCFYSGNYSFNFSSLKELIIKDCPNMKTFSSGSLNTPKLRNVLYEEEPIMIGENDLNTIIQEASKKRVNSNLKKLILSGRDIMSIWQGEFEENFDKVETLELIKDEHTYIPIHIFTKFITLEQLELTVSSYEEIFSCEEGEEHVGALAQLNVLQLCGLFNLKSIWKQDFQFKSILQNLHELSVMFCHNLMTLLPCSSSFENLTTLKVFYCNGLQNLISSSTAKSLVCLEELEIEECEMIVEVLANEGDKDEDEIVFEKLKELTLVKLKSLTCFYSGNCALNFPFLESLNVSRCFKMKTFSREGLDMPRLQKVNKKVCTNDLNSIIQQLQNDCQFCDRMAKELEEKRKSYMKVIKERVEWRIRTYNKCH